jgi:membrane protein YqaA with SNARE-associated domain
VDFGELGDIGGSDVTHADSENLGAPEPPSGLKPATKSGYVRRLYDWMLHWADTPYGLPALAVLALVESSVFPLPPDPLLIALCLGATYRSLRFAAVATVASVLGGILGYGLGAVVWGSVSGFFFDFVPGVTPEAFADVQGYYERWDFWAVFVAGLTPIPYKVFTISAGVFAINFPVFVLASVLSRGLRFFLLAGLVYRYGEPIGAFIDRYFNLLTWVFTLILISGFVLIRVVLS